MGITVRISTTLPIRLLDPYKLIANFFLALPFVSMTRSLDVLLVLLNTSFVLVTDLAQM